MESDPIGLGGGINSYVYLSDSPLISIDPLGLENLILEPKKDPAYKWDALYNRKAYFTVGSHGDPSDSSSILGPDGQWIGVPAVGNAILKAGWDGKKPIQLVICYAGKGGKDSFAQQLANYLASQTGQPVTVLGSPNEVTVGYSPFNGFASPGQGGWLHFNAKP